MLTTLTFWYIKNWVIVKIYYSFRIVSYLVTSDYGSVTPGCTGTSRNPSFSLQWKSDEITRLHYSNAACHQLTLLTRGEKMHVSVWGFKVASCKRASLKSTRFSQEKKVGYLSNRVVNVVVNVSCCLFIGMINGYLQKKNMK